AFRTFSQQIVDVEEETMVSLRKPPRSSEDLSRVFERTLQVIQDLNNLCIGPDQSEFNHTSRVVVIDSLKAIQQAFFRQQIPFVSTSSALADARDEEAILPA